MQQDIKTCRPLLMGQKKQTFLINSFLYHIIKIVNFNPVIWNYSSSMFNDRKRIPKSLTVLNPLMDSKLKYIVKCILSKLLSIIVAGILNENQIAYCRI